MHIISASRADIERWRSARRSRAIKSPACAITHLLVAVGLVFGREEECSLFVCLQLRAPPAINCANLHRVETQATVPRRNLYLWKLWHSVCVLMIFNFNARAWLMLWSAPASRWIRKKNLWSVLLIGSFCAYLWGAGGPVDQIWVVGVSILYSNEVLKCTVIYRYDACSSSQHPFHMSSLKTCAHSIFQSLRAFGPSGTFGYYLFIGSFNSAGK
jgi:hypothetical protein